ncbi:MAG: gliding motility-associated C-terminal domain-containing protein [Crocinitomicaceae bacterium]|nr:gliding motility-associated C-terminal domain-containing protein [Crocinitomicaceae bacterium]
MLNFFKNIISFSLGFFPRIKPVCFIVYVCWIHPVAAQQNLVYNGDFEEYSSCPITVSGPNQNPLEIEKCKGWKAPTFGTSDYFNSCSIGATVSTPINFTGFQNPYSGHGYLGGYFASYLSSGLNLNKWWEYVQGILIKPLEKEIIYKLSLNISVAEYSDLAINEFGVFFSDFPISSTNADPLDINPQCVFYDPTFFKDSLNWIHLETYFLGQGGEKYLTIGNFKNDIETDTLRIFDSEPTYNNPYSAYIYIDNVQLIESDIEIPNVFTPNGDGVNDLVPFPDFGNSSNRIVVVNRWGNLIYESNGINPIWDGKDTSGKTCTEGTYFYRINNTNISGFIQLMR